MATEKMSETEQAQPSESLPVHHVLQMPTHPVC